MPPEQEAVSADARSLLLETLAARAGGGGGINVQELLLSRLGDLGDEDDPTVGLIARYLVQSQTEQDEEAPSDDEDEEDSPEVDEARAEERARVFGQLRRTMEEMYEELEALRERNETLAAALGACHLCWGEDFGCEVCGGTGGPGSSMPDGPLLARLVVPAARRLREEKPDPRA